MDKFEIRIVNASDLHEEWVLDEYDANEVSNVRLVQIFINGQNLMDTVVSIEKKRMAENSYSPVDAKYGHNTAEYMRSQFDALSDKNSYNSEYGIELFCCPDCGVAGCWSVICHFRIEGEKVYMERFHHNHRDWEYDISYCFTRENYEAEIEKLK